MTTNIHFFISRSFILIMRNILERNLYRKSKHTFQVEQNFFSRKSCLLRENVEKILQNGAGSQMTIWRMRIPCWIPKGYKYTQSCCVILQLLLFHCNNGRTNAPPLYVIRTLPVLLLVKSSRTGKAAVLMMAKLDTIKSKIKRRRLQKRALCPKDPEFQKPLVHSRKNLE